MCMLIQARRRTLRLTVQSKVFEGSEPPVSGGRSGMEMLKEGDFDRLEVRERGGVDGDASCGESMIAVKVVAEENVDGVEGYEEQI